MLTGLFFGSFNPVHIGHMALANYMLAFTEMKEVWFVVSPHNPLKEKSSLLAGHHRLHMVNLAIQDYPGLKSSNIEFGLNQPNYTIHTLVHLKEKYPKKKFALIMGGDNLQSLPKWKNYESILENYPIYVYPRPEADITHLSTHPSVHLTQAPLMDISSTFLRHALKTKKDIPFFFPPNVYRYIQEMHFYV